MKPKLTFYFSCFALLFLLSGCQFCEKDESDPCALERSFSFIIADSVSGENIYPMDNSGSYDPAELKALHNYDVPVEVNYAYSGLAGGVIFSIEDAKQDNCTGYFGYTTDFAVQLATSEIDTLSIRYTMYADSWFDQSCERISIMHDLEYTYNNFYVGDISSSILHFDDFQNGSAVFTLLKWFLYQKLWYKLFKQLLIGSLPLQKHIIHS